MTEWNKAEAIPLICNPSTPNKFSVYFVVECHLVVLFMLMNYLTLLTYLIQHVIISLHTVENWYLIIWG
jgi:hypothetical protein